LDELKTAADGRARVDEQLSLARAALAELQEDRSRPSFFASAGGATAELQLNDIVLFRIDEITYEERAPRREAMENIFGTFRGVSGVNLLYLILGDGNGVTFYLGLVHNLDDPAMESQVLQTIGNNILAPAIRGNFRGCELADVKSGEKEDILKRLRSARQLGLLEGVPTIDEADAQKSETFQGVERLVDVMLGDRDAFGLAVLARPYTDYEIDATEQRLHELSDLLAPLAHASLQYSDATAANENETQNSTWERSASHGTGASDSASDSHSTTHTDDTRHDESSSVQAADSSNWSHSASKQDPTLTYHDTSRSGSQDKTSGWSQSSSKSDSAGGQKAETYTSSISESRTDNTVTNDSESHSAQRNKNASESHHKSRSRATTAGTAQNGTLSWQLALEQKSALGWLKYIDDVLLPRVDDGRGKGLYLACAYVFGDSTATVLRLAHTMMSLGSGPKGNRAPLVFYDLSSEELRNGACAHALQELQIPEWQSSAIPCCAAGRSQLVTEDATPCGRWLTAAQLSILAGMPQKEVIGLGLREEVEFGLNPPMPAQGGGGDLFQLGRLVQCGREQEAIPVCLSRSSLDKHVFVTGVTGSGKTTTCQNLLLQSKMPFLVIEPAKTEYRELAKTCDDLIFFTPGDNDVAPFFLNPFELFPGETITSRADMLKATFEATFEMQAAIPQILEAGIYRIYEKRGWNIGTSLWHGKGADDPDGPFADGVYAFPTMQEYYDIMPEVIESQGFDERLYSEYLGTVRAYLQGMLMGAKGMMMNTQRSVDFCDLVRRKVVIELDAVRSGAEKSLIIGFVLTNLLQAVRAEYTKANHAGKQFRHITLVEEAHRLLARYQPGDSLNKKQGVEVFADMLAEVRKYGESMIIADQIPDKMTPEVLKNTNTKIVHKLFAQDDKEAIGNTMALGKEQKAFLSNLVAGRAIVFSQDWPKAVQVQVDPLTATTGRKDIAPEEIRQRALAYYEARLARGILGGLERVADVTRDDVEAYLKLLADGALPRAFADYFQKTGAEDPYDALVKALARRMDWARRDVLLAYLSTHVGPPWTRAQRAAATSFVERVAAHQELPYAEAISALWTVFQ